MNGGFGLVLDGSLEVDRISESMLSWDVYNRVARRSLSLHYLDKSLIFFNSICEKAVQFFYDYLQCIV